MYPCIHYIKIEFLFKTIHLFLLLRVIQPLDLATFKEPAHTLQDCTLVLHNLQLQGDWTPIPLPRGFRAILWKALAFQRLLRNLRPPHQRNKNTMVIVLLSRLLVFFFFFTEKIIVIKYSNFYSVSSHSEANNVWQPVQKAAQYNSVGEKSIGLCLQYNAHSRRTRTTKGKNFICFFLLLDRFISSK